VTTTSSITPSCAEAAPAKGSNVSDIAAHSKLRLWGMFLLLKII